MRNLLLLLLIAWPVGSVADQAVTVKQVYETGNYQVANFSRECSDPDASLVGKSNSSVFGCFMLIDIRSNPREPALYLVFLENKDWDQAGTILEVYKYDPDAKEEAKSPFMLVEASLLIEDNGI